jgi:hypothetical protein
MKAQRETSRRYETDADAMKVATGIKALDAPSSASTHMNKQGISRASIEMQGANIAGDTKTRDPPLLSKFLDRGPKFVARRAESRGPSRHAISLRTTFRACASGGR